MPARTGAAAALRDAFLSALVALGLFGAIVGLKTDAGPASLVLTPRPWAVAIAVGVVFAGRLALLAWRRPRPAAPPRPGRGLGRLGRFAAPVLLAVALSLPAYAGRYWLDLGILVLT